MVSLVFCAGFDGGGVLAAAPGARAVPRRAVATGDPGPDATNGPARGTDRPAPTLS